MGEIFNRYLDTAGNYHYSDTDSGHHIITKNSSLCNSCCNISCILQHGTQIIQCSGYISQKEIRQSTLNLMEKILIEYGYKVERE